MASIAQVGLIFVEIGLGFLDFAIFHTLTHASLRCSQILLSQSVITDYLKLQSKGSASNSWILGHVERYMPDRLRSTFWVLAQQEHMVEYVLTNTSVRLKRLLTSQKFSHWATAVGSVICITAAGFLLVPLNKNFGTTFVLVGSLLATSKGLFGAFSYRGRLASVFVSMMLALSSMLFDSDRLLPLLITSALAVSAGLLLMILVVPPRFCSVQEDFLGMATAYPAVSIVLFALAALLAGVPPSPLFFVEDVIFDHVMQRSLFSVTLMGIIHALNGVLLFKAVASLTFGKLSHVTNTRSRRGDARV